MRPDVVYAYVRELLTTLTGERPEPDGDGDLPVRYRGAQFFVRIAGSTDPWVQVFSVAVTEVEASAELFEHLNQINRDVRFARAFFVGSQVLIETEIWADDVNPANFEHACSNIAGATDAFTPRLTELGGRALFEESKSPEYTPAPIAMGFTAGMLE